MVINHRFGHPCLFGEPAQGQRFRTFLSNQLPGDIQQLALALFARHPATRLRAGILLRYFSA
ncbi:hypothetical protein D3C85_1769810 [compost metagenome]